MIFLVKIKYTTSVPLTKLINYPVEINQMQCAGAYDYILEKFQHCQIADSNHPINEDVTSITAQT